MLNKSPVLSNRPIFSQTYHSNEPPQFGLGIFIYRSTSEERTNATPEYLPNQGCGSVEIVDENISTFSYSFKKVTKSVSIVDEDAIKQFFHDIGCNLIYVDITGLTHSTWAVLLKVGFLMDISIKIIYVEPLTYTSPPETPHTYNLSLKINPIKPIPGFAVLRSIGSSDFSFIPLLGFEKRRFELMLTNVDPPQHSVYPVIGVPGFQLGFPFEAYLVNRKKLTEGDLYQNVRYASASCPFRLYYVLQDLASETRTNLFKIALTGTKPHALGAVLYHLFSKITVELLYDHPERKSGRSSGISKLHLYHIDLFKDFLTE